MDIEKVHAFTYIIDVTIGKQINSFFDQLENEFFEVPADEETKAIFEELKKVIYKKELNFWKSSALSSVKKQYFVIRFNINGKNRLIVFQDIWFYTKKQQIINL